MSIFSKVQIKNPNTSIFNLSHQVKNTTVFGKLTPFLCQEVLPGDKWRVKTEILTRMLAMDSPVMHNISVYTHFFFVPYRIIWDKWEEFVTQSLNGTFNNSVPQLPLVHFTGSDLSNVFQPGRLGDYLGLKCADPNNIAPAVINVLPFLAYQKIWSDFYRDENLDTQLDEDMFSMDSGITESSDISFIRQLTRIRWRSFKKDYFTSALPWAQKGDAVTLPIGGEAPVYGPDYNNSTDPQANFRLHYEFPLQGGLINSEGPWTMQADNLAATLPDTRYQWQFNNGNNFVTGIVGNFTPGSHIGNADLSNATAITINELRRANALQRWLETNARGGSRYIELLYSHFGQRSKDARLQRSEFLGGGKSMIMINEVIQNSASTINGSDTPQGNMAGHALSASRNHAFTRHFDEHGIVIGIMSVMPDANYMQGIPRMFLKQNVFDFGWPLLANIGEQEIYNAELYFNNAINSLDNLPTFGYTPRYAEYKFINDQIAGDFRTSLDFWHLARKFSNQPALNSQFISTQTMSSSPRIFPSYDSDYILNNMYLDCKVIRKLPKYGTPAL